MQTIHYIVLGCCVWLLLGLFFWAQFHGGKDMQPDLDEADERYVDQDGERVYYADDLGAVGTRSDGGTMAFIQSDQPVYCTCMKCDYEHEYLDGVVPTSGCPSCGVNGWQYISDVKDSDWREHVPNSGGA